MRDKGGGEEIICIIEQWIKAAERGRLGKKVPEVLIQTRIRIFMGCC